MQNGWRSVAPGLAALVAPHEPHHRLIRSADLFHVLAESFELVTELALFAGVLVNFFLHLVVEPRPVFLQLQQLVLPYVLLRLLVEVDLVIVLGQLLRTYLPLQHLRLGLGCALPPQTQTDRVDAFVQHVV